jgi:hypothetical protein
MLRLFCPQTVARGVLPKIAFPRIFFQERVTDYQRGTSADPKTTLLIKKRDATTDFKNQQLLLQAQKSFKI